MAGERVPAEAHRIAPLGVHTRQSTDVLTIDDQAIAAAVRLIRQHACDRIMGGELLRRIPLSRRVFEHRLTRHVGRSPHADILRLKLNRVKQLLVETDLSVEAIAGLAGFEHPESLSVTSRREIGLRPHAFRRRRQAGHRGVD